jgi:hypothetical protein
MALLIICMAHYSTLNMKAINCRETSVDFQRTTRSYATGCIHLNMFAMFLTYISFGPPFLKLECLYSPGSDLSLTNA